MFCNKGKGKILNLSESSNKSCSGSVCGGWKFVHNGCSLVGDYCSGRSGAWLSAVSVCQTLRSTRPTKIQENTPSSSPSSSSSSDLHSSSSSSQATQSSSSSEVQQNLFDKNSWSASVPEPYKNYLDQASERWSQFIKFNPYVFQSINSFDPSWNGISLDSFYEFNNSNSGVIAACGPTQGVDLTGNAIKFNSTRFAIEVNAYYQSYFSPQDWVDIIAHELGHALGIGIFWDPAVTSITGGVAPSENFLNGSAYVNAQQAYNSITSATRQKIPLENEGGDGTASAHWEDDYRPSTSAGSMGVGYAGLTNELMVGFYSQGQESVISDLSIKTLVDFGYDLVQEGLNEGIPNLSNGTGLMRNLGMKLNCQLPKKVSIVSLNLPLSLFKKL
jgi:hypothetical protein